MFHTVRVNNNNGGLCLRRLNSYSLTGGIEYCYAEENSGGRHLLAECETTASLLDGVRGICILNNKVGTKKANKLHLKT